MKKKLKESYSTFSAMHEVLLQTCTCDAVFISFVNGLFGTSNSIVIFKQWDLRWHFCWHSSVIQPGWKQLNLHTIDLVFRQYSAIHYTKIRLYYCLSDLGNGNVLVRFVRCQLYIYYYMWLFIWTACWFV